MKTLSTVTLLILFIGCTQGLENSHAKSKINQKQSESFWKYLSRVPTQHDTVYAFSRYIAETNNSTLETAYLEDRIFDSILSPSKDSRQYYFTIATTALSGRAMVDKKFNRDLCERIKADPKEFIEFLNNCNKVTIENIAFGIDNYFSYHLKAAKPDPELVNLLIETSKKIDPQSIANVEYLISRFPSNW